MQRGKLKSIGLTLLAVALTVAMSMPAGANAADAEGTALKSINIGASKIKVVDGGWNETDGNYLYYGSYDGNATKYRILKNEDGKMLIDSDKILFQSLFDNGTYNYDESKVRTAYLKDGKGPKGNLFATKELAGLADTKLEASEKYTISPYDYKDYESLDNKAFLLTANEANQLYKDNEARKKTGFKNWWWLRSANADGDGHVGGVMGTGKIHCGNEPHNVAGGVAPAANLKWSSVLFTSANGQAKGSEVGTLDKVEDSTSHEWKVTLVDADKTIALQKATIEGDEISVPYTYTDGDEDTAVSQISVIVTAGDIATGDSEVLYYGKLADVNSSKSGVGKFTLPTDLPEGYKIYAVAEDVNGANATDYASAPQEITWQKSGDDEKTDGDAADKSDQTKKVVKKITKTTNANPLKTSDEARLGLLVTVAISSLAVGAGLYAFGRKEEQ